MILGPRGTVLRRVCMVTASCLCTIGCGNATSSQLARKATPAEAAAAAMQAYDANGDGKLSKDELAKSPALTAGLALIDSNRDGVVTRDELQARLQADEDGPKLIGLAVSVTAKQRPLPGATVTLTPEPFMGSGLQSYSGTTTGGGSCQLKGAEADLPGLPTGYYQAKVVDSRLNIDQVLGCEIAADASGNRLELQLH
jgi:hypothetical protein